MVSAAPRLSPPSPLRRASGSAGERERRERVAVGARAEPAADAGDTGEPARFAAGKVERRRAPAGVAAAGDRQRARRARGDRPCASTRRRRSRSPRADRAVPTCSASLPVLRSVNVRAPLRSAAAGESAADRPRCRRPPARSGAALWLAIVTKPVFTPPVVGANVTSTSQDAPAASVLAPQPSAPLTHCDGDRQRAQRVVLGALVGDSAACAWPTSRRAGRRSPRRRPPSGCARTR